MLSVAIIKVNGHDRFLGSARRVGGNSEGGVPLNTARTFKICRAPPWRVELLVYPNTQRSPQRWGADVGLGTSPVLSPVSMFI